jgi:hypothetical protein
MEKEYAVVPIVMDEANGFVHAQVEMAEQQVSGSSGEEMSGRQVSGSGSEYVYGRLHSELPCQSAAEPEHVEMSLLRTSSPRSQSVSED